MMKENKLKKSQTKFNITLNQYPKIHWQSKKAVTTKKYRNEMQISIVILKTPFCVIFILQRKLFSFIIIMLCIICIYQKLVIYNNIFIDIHIYVYVYGTYQHIITTIKNYNNKIFMNKRKQTKIIINKKETLKKTTRE